MTLRILAASDIHGDMKLAEALAKKAQKEKVDLVVLCGDLTYAESSTKGIIGPFVKKNKKVLLIPGNHETVATADFLAEMYSAVNLHGYSIKMKDVGFFGCGSANIGKFQLNETEIYDTLKKGFKYVKDTKKKVMITHVHPADSLIERFTSVFPGSKGVTKAIKEMKPDLVLCGHVHEAEGIEDRIGDTRIINVGRNGRVLEI
ncbi:metallophosphoesterase family protein [Candidatus Woesearchaeota archaeon]|nr:metallophosphoesterase family protein [Candidatus Woesearchaeota archaeon]